MAVPLIIGLGLGAVGLYKSGKAIKDNMDANDLNSAAQGIVWNAESELESSRDDCQKTLTYLGELKVEAVQGNIHSFLEIFKKIRNKNEIVDTKIGDLQLSEFNEQALQEMDEKVSFLVSSGLGAGGGAISGALAAFGAYNGTMAFAAASTGTAISSLSGVAATNATLAWLGGGTLASGGMGVAGGTLALGALAAGPALLVAGWYMGAKAESKVNDALSNLAEAERFKVDIDSAILLTDGIRDVAKKASDVISKLRMHARRNLKLLKNVIDSQGVDYSIYTLENKHIVMKNLKIAQVLKALIDTAILDQDGNLLGDASSNIIKMQNYIDGDFREL